MDIWYVILNTAECETIFTNVWEIREGRTFIAWPVSWTLAPRLP